MARRSGEPARADGSGPLGARERAPVRRCLAVLGVLSVASAGGTVGAPALWNQPLVLVLLTPRLPFIAHASGHVHWSILAPLVVARLCLADPAHFLLGRHGGDAARLRLRRWSQRSRLFRWAALSPGGTVHRALARVTPASRGSAAAVVAVRPIGRHLMLAGASHARPRTVAVADVAGTVLYVVAVLAGATVLA